jgi:hypothetical protein
MHASVRYNATPAKVSTNIVGVLLGRSNLHVLFARFVFSFYYYPSLVRVDTLFSPTFSPPDSQSSLVRISILCHLEPLSFRCRLFDSRFHVHTFGLRPQHSNSIPGVDTCRTNIPSINGVSKPLLHISYFQDPHLGRKDPIGKRLNGS